MELRVSGVPPRVTPAATPPPDRARRVEDPSNAATEAHGRGSSRGLPRFDRAGDPNVIWTDAAIQPFGRCGPAGSGVTLIGMSGRPPRIPAVILRIALAAVVLALLVALVATTRWVP